jgi:hypothetical protein
MPNVFRTVQKVCCPLFSRYSAPVLSRSWRSRRGSGRSSSSREGTNMEVSKSDLSPERRRLVETMQQINYGRILNLGVRAGEPKDSAPFRGGFFVNRRPSGRSCDEGRPFALICRTLIEMPHLRPHWKCHLSLSRRLRDTESLRGEDRATRGLVKSDDKQHGRHHSRAERPRRGR